MAKKIVLAGACRTAIGTMGGALSTVPAVDLGAIVIKEALNRAGVPADKVDHVYMGCVIQAGLGQNVARQATIKAGLPIETTAVTVNVVCGSGLNCVNMAAQMIEAGDADIVVAGGMESMSRAPFALPNARFGYRMNNGVLVDTMIKDALWDAFNDYHMIKTADNICEQWGLTREELDEFAVNSQNKAEKAMAEGKFKDEIVPVEVKQKKNTVIVDTDEGPRPGTTMEGLAKLRAINPGGFVTAGNASGINDGAAAIVVMSEEKAKELGVKPMATWVAGALGGVEPEIMGVGPVASTRKVLERTGLTIDDMDLIEAKSDYALKASENQLQGKIYDEVVKLRKKIIYEIAFIESAIDDPEHISLDGYTERLMQVVDAVLIEIEELIKNAENGKLIKEGIDTVIVGKPNAGKSSLLNRMLGEEKAIVTDIAGTTRDIIQESMKLGGISLNLIDTAGIHETNDVVEKIGVGKAKECIEKADLVVYVVDASVPLDESDQSIIEMLSGKKVIVLLNKSDMKTVVYEQLMRDNIVDIIGNDMDQCRIISTSTKEKTGLREFEEQIRDMFFTGEISFNDEILITNVRQERALVDAKESLCLVKQSLEDEMPEDFYSIDLMNAYASLGSIIGEEVEDDLVQEIFSKFCMGK